MEKELAIITDGKYDGNGDYRNHYTRMTIIQETEKAVKVSRIIKSKEKEYTCWIPKSAFEMTISNIPYGIKKWFWKRMESYTEWFLTAY